MLGTSAGREGGLGKLAAAAPTQSVFAMPARPAETRAIIKLPTYGYPQQTPYNGDLRSQTAWQKKATDYGRAGGSLHRCKGSRVSQNGISCVGNDSKGGRVEQSGFRFGSNS